MDFFALHRAAGTLAPASLRLRADGARYATFITDVELTGGVAAVILDPVMVDEASPRAFLDFQLEGTDLWVAGRLEVSAARGRLYVRRPPSPRPTRPRRLPGQGDVLVAAFVPDGTGLGRCFCPVLDAGAQVLRIESSVPFPAGTVLKNLVLTHRHELLRRAEGLVIDTGTVVHADGRIGYEHGIRLRNVHFSDELTDDESNSFEVRDPERVRAILWALCDLEYEVTVRSGNRRTAARLLPGRGPRTQPPQLVCELEEPIDRHAGTVQVECTLFGSGLRFVARVTGQEREVVHLLAAPVVRESHRRDEERFVFPSTVAATVRFRHPLGVRAEEHRLTDLSGSGFGFSDDGAPVWPELPLKEVEIALPGLVLHPPVAHVRTVDQRRFGVEMRGLDEREAQQLRVELLRLSGHPAHLSDGEDLDAILDFHKSVGLLEPDMERNLLSCLDETRRTWRLAHQHPDGLMYTTVGQWKGAVGATANVVRGYDDSWILQHTAVASPGVHATPGLMYTMLFGLITPRSDCEYLASYASDDFKSLHTNWTSFANAFSTPHFRGATPFNLWGAEALPVVSTEPSVRLLGTADEVLTESFAARLLDPVCARSLCLQRGQIGIERTRDAFARVGLERGREAWASFRGDRCRAVLLREWSSPGLSLSSLLSSGLLLSGPREADPDGSGALALCRVLRALPVPGNPPMRFLFAPKSVDEKPIRDAGFRLVGGCVLYGLHRIGLQEFLRFFAARYGFLQARMSVRRSVAA